MIIKKTLFVISALVFFTSITTQAFAQNQAALLKQLRENTCTIKSGSFLKKAKATTALASVKKDISALEKELKEQDPSAYEAFQNDIKAEMAKGC